MTTKTVFADLETTRAAALRALGEVKPAPTGDAEGYAFYGDRTDAGRTLPEPYLVHFLLVDLLGFPSSGQEEKVAWTVPVEFGGKLFAIAHRKLGMGVFAQDRVADNEVAEQLVNRLHKAIRAARPFFDWLASEAVAASQVNVINCAGVLLARFQFLRVSYRQKLKDLEGQKDKWPEQYDLERQSNWLALAAIDAFFSWTEHVFILLAIVSSKVTTGLEVTELAEADWPEKFKRVFDISTPKTKKRFDQLVEIRREVRNFMAHGAFGADGRAFHFHSTAGAVPVLLPHKLGTRKFMVAGASDFQDEAALEIIEEFIQFIWSGPREPARLLIQESGLDLILPMARNGRFATAMQSMEAMEELIDCLHQQSDRAANMDW